MQAMGQHHIKQRPKSQLLRQYLASGLEKIMIFKKKSKKSDFLFKSDFFNLNRIFFF